MKRSFLEFIFISGIILLLAGCGASMESINVINGEKLNSSNLLTDQNSIYIVNGGDGMKKTYFSAFVGEEVAKGSGESAINVELEQLKSITSKVVLEKLVLSEDKALEIGTINKSDYLIYSRTEKWTDPLGINCNQNYLDEASVVISLYSIADKKLLNTTRLSNSNCAPTLNGIPLRPGSPEILFKELFTKWINSTFVKTK